MFRKACMLVAMLMVLAPMASRPSSAMGEHHGGLALPELSFSAPWLLSPGQLAIVCGCLLVLALTASLRWLEA
jgi:hypothetical protein